MVVEPYQMSCKYPCTPRFEAVMLYNCCDKKGHSKDRSFGVVMAALSNALLAPGPAKYIVMFDAPRPLMDAVVFRFPCVRMFVAPEVPSPRATAWCVQEPCNAAAFSTRMAVLI